MNRHVPLALAAVALSVLLSPPAAAQVQVTFPLQGYYRPGKFMPVRVVTAAKPSGPVTLRAEGAVALWVAPGPGAMNTVAPWLAADVVRAPRWEVAGAGDGAFDAPLTPLEAQQVLVAIVGTDTAAATAAAAELFPGRPAVVVALTGATAMPGDPMAWEALDLVVFDDPNHVHLVELLEQGVSVMVRSEARPAVSTWEGGPGRWFVRFDPAGPQGAIHPDAYAPVRAWNPGWPAPLRRRAGLLAAVFCLAALGATLWRRTWRATVVVVVASAAAAGGFAAWGARQRMVCDATTGVDVAAPTGTQSDQWTYHRPLRRREIGLPPTKPVFASARHLRHTDLTLHAGASGRPLGFTWRAEAGTTLALLNRSFTPAVRGPVGGGPASPASTPAYELAVQNYLRPGDVLERDPIALSADDETGWSTWWPYITVRRPAP